MLRDDMEKNKAEKSNRDWMGSVYGWSWEFSLLRNSEQSATLNVDHFSLILASSEVFTVWTNWERVHSRKNKWKLEGLSEKFELVGLVDITLGRRSRFGSVG